MQKPPYLGARHRRDLVEEVPDELVEDLLVGVPTVLQAVVALDGQASRLGRGGLRVRVVVAVVPVVTVVAVVTLVTAVLIIAQLELMISIDQQIST